MADALLLGENGGAPARAVGFKFRLATLYEEGSRGFGKQEAIIAIEE